MLLWGIKRSRGHVLEAAAIKAFPQHCAISHPPRGSWKAQTPWFESKELVGGWQPGQTRSPSGQISSDSIPMQHGCYWKALDLRFRKGGLLEEHAEFTRQDKQSSNSSPLNTSTCCKGPRKSAPSCCLGKSGFLGDGHGHRGTEPASAASHGKATLQPTPCT